MVAKPRGDGGGIVALLGGTRTATARDEWLAALRRGDGLSRQSANSRFLTSRR